MYISYKWYSDYDDKFYILFTNFQLDNYLIIFIFFM